MTLDWDGQIRMDPSSKYAMQRLQDTRDRFDIAFACDTDHARHGIVTPDAGLLAPDHYLAVAIDYLFAHRPSGTEDIYKIYAESFKGPEHLQRILKEAQTIVDAAIAPASLG